MESVAITLLATGSEPSPLHARAHAIKNCVSVLVGLASTIEHHVDPTARSRVTQLVDVSRRLKDLLGHQAKEGLPVREDVGVRDVVQAVVDRLRPAADALGVTLAHQCAGGTLLGDFGELAEALYNVSSNALHASRQGSTVRIATRRDGDGDQEWRVEDQGCGIPANLMARLGTVGLTTRNEGTGLGLSLALQVVSRHKGVMRIESIEGEGTTVMIWLPGNLGSVA
jgi:signal transduction histidine kinase